jgi:hypothetical protein
LNLLQSLEYFSPLEYREAETDKSMYLWLLQTSVFL